MTELKLPSIDYAAISPILIMLGTALLACWSRRWCLVAGGTWCS